MSRSVSLYSNNEEGQLVRRRESSEDTVIYKPVQSLHNSVDQNESPESCSPVR